METNLPYCGELHIDAGTTKLILDLLDSIRSAVPVVNPPGPDDPDQSRENPNLDRLRNILVLARQHSSDLEGIFNPDELLRYVRYASEYQEITTRMEKVLEEIRNCRDTAYKFAGGLAELVLEHLRITGALPEPDENDEPCGTIPIRNEGIKLKVV